MAKIKYNNSFESLLLHCISQPDPMFFMLEWLSSKLMEAEISSKIGAEKSERNEERIGYRCGYRTRRFDTRMGTMYLLVPKVRNGGYIPFFVTDRKRSEAALIQVVQEAFVQGVSTRKMDRLAKSLGIEGISRSQVSEMTKELDEQVEAFRTRDLSSIEYPVLWADALYERVRFDGKVLNMAILLVCGVDEDGKREVLAIEPMLEESQESYHQVFEKLKKRGLKTPALIISDAHSGLVSAIRKSFSGSSWQRCKVHFMRNILAHVPHKDKEGFAQELKQIWLAIDAASARERAKGLSERYGKRFPDAIRILEEGLEDSLQFFALPELEPAKISSTNMLERLNREIRRRTRVVGIFPNKGSYIRLVTTFLMEYAEDWSVSRSYLSAESIRCALKHVA